MIFYFPSYFFLDRKLSKDQGKKNSVRSGKLLTIAATLSNISGNPAALVTFFVIKCGKNRR